MLYLIALLLCATNAFADKTATITIHNRSQYDLSLQYHDERKMCNDSPRPQTIPSLGQEQISFCFPSSIWDAGLDAYELIEYHIGPNDDRLIFKAFVDTKKNESNYLTLRLIGMKFINSKQRFKTTPHLNENEFTTIKTGVDESPSIIIKDTGTTTESN